MNQLAWEYLLSQVALIGVVTFFLQRLVRHFDQIVKHVEGLVAWRATVDERHRNEDQDR